MHACGRILNAGRLDKKVILAEITEICFAVFDFMPCFVGLCFSEWELNNIGNIFVQLILDILTAAFGHPPVWNIYEFFFVHVGII